MEKKMSNFNLSEKRIIIEGNDYPNVILTEDVKEFIRLLKYEYPEANALHKTIDKLAGDKLI